MSQAADSGVSNRPEGDNSTWLAMQPEEVLEPALAICDPHHHLWDFEAHRYLLPDLLADTASGHAVRSTVFIECTAMYRADGPEELRSLGETEFVNGAAAMAASGRYGTVKACAGIVGFADLGLGARVEGILEKHIAVGGGRFKGVRHISAFDASGAIRRSHTFPTSTLLGEAKFR